MLEAHGAVGKVFGRAVHLFRFPSSAPVAVKKVAPITPEAIGLQRWRKYVIASFFVVSMLCNISKSNYLY